MMLMLLLTELARLQVHLSVVSDELHIQAPVGVLTDELRQAITERKAALMRYASFPYVVADGVAPSQAIGRSRISPLSPRNARKPGATKLA